MKQTEIPYWMAFAHATGFSGRRKMEFLVEAVFNKNITLTEAIEDFRQGTVPSFTFTEKEKNGLLTSIDDLANFSFLAEELQNRGIRCINVFEESYPKTLKQKLNMHAPVLLYIRGNTDLLGSDCVAIVGSRKSSQTSLTFTDRIAERTVAQNKTVVSGFAKGVDRQALDSSLKYGGKSIIVLPQGINTYRSKSYYAHINKGEVLVLSTYHPRAAWSIGLAMDRNNTIYGLADEIYAAESDSKGGTWTGVTNGLKRGWKVFVRMPGQDEKNANLKLIEQGAVPVGMDGEVLQKEDPVSKVSESDLFSDYSETTGEEKKLSKQELIEKVLQLLEDRKNGLTISQIGDLLPVSASRSTIMKWLKSSDKLGHEKRGKDLYFNTPERIVPPPKLFP